MLGRGIIMILWVCLMSELGPFCSTPSWKHFPRLLELSQCSVGLQALFCTLLSEIMTLTNICHKPPTIVPLTRPIWNMMDSWRSHREMLLNNEMNLSWMTTLHLSFDLTYVELIYIFSRIHDRLQANYSVLYLLPFEISGLYFFWSIAIVWALAACSLYLPCKLCTHIFRTGT